MKTILTDDALRQRLIQGALVRNSWRLAAEQVIDTYQRLCADGSPAASLSPEAIRD
jgi:hypothetical protein